MSQSKRAITIRCVECGLEVTGVRDTTTGLVFASDRSRPDIGTPVVDGYCMHHSPQQVLGVAPSPLPKTRICTLCGGQYPANGYRQHAHHDQFHLDWLKAREERRRAYQKRKTDPHEERDAAIVRALVGPPRRTLLSVGADFGISRERVRQIAKRAGIRARELPPLPPKPVAPPKMVPCKVCGERYPCGGYEDHLIEKGHVRNVQEPIVPDTVARAASRLIRDGRTWDDAAAMTGVRRSNLAKVLLRGGHIGYGWQQRHLERNLEIARRFFVEHESAATIVAAMGLPHRATVFNVTGMVRAVGGYDQIERLMPRPVIESEAVQNRLARQRKANEPRDAEIRRRLAAGERLSEIARAMRIHPSTVRTVRERQKGAN